MASTKAQSFNVLVLIAIYYNNRLGPLKVTSFEVGSWN